MTDKTLLSVIFGVVSTALFLLMATSCVSTPETRSTGTGAGSGIDDYVLVDCKLPGQVRQLGTRATYIAPRRPIKTTKSDCGIRGGEFVLFDRSDYSSALSSLLPKARAGDPTAQTYVGEIYEKGLGLANPNYAEAANWYRKAAASNHAPAQTSLGSLYERGLGVSTDKAQALEWYRKASGLTQDSLVFESELKAENERFKRELAVRNQTAMSLKRELRQTQKRMAQQKNQAGNIASTSKPNQTTASAATNSNKPATAPQGPAQSDQGTLVAQEAKLKRQLESQQRDAESEAERIAKELKAVKAMKTGAQSQKGPEGAKPKKAQLGKLELVRNEQYRLILDTKSRIAKSP